MGRLQARVKRGLMGSNEEGRKLGFQFQARGEQMSDSREESS